MKEMYRALAVTAAHLHLITGDYFSDAVKDGEGPILQHPHCAMKTHYFYQQNIRTSANIP